MRLKLPRFKAAEQLREFDYWITQSLGEIKDTERFVAESAAICQALETLGTYTGQFSSVEHANADSLAKSMLGVIAGLKEKQSVECLRGVFALLFLVTGRSDNNCKCQYPLFLRDTLRWENYPKVVRKNKKKLLNYVPLSRVLDDETVAKTVYTLKNYPSEQGRVLSSYLSFLLDGAIYQQALWAIGNTYFRLKACGLQQSFLLPLVVYRIRGSVSASGGHDPEMLLRERMREWGLDAGTDFNVSDVVVGQQKQGKKKKTRAYDFVLPYAVPGWEQRLFIQCQFYAGDSGSVSHKNVDQMRASRDFTKRQKGDPLFFEYLDGAGYFGSLNSDLQHILMMRDTYGFFQIRTAPIKLRAALQEIGLLTPLEVIHAWSLCKGDEDAMRASLFTDGYRKDEIDRVFGLCVRRSILYSCGSKVDVEPSKLEIARRYLLLDFIAVRGKRLIPSQAKGTLLVPGFGMCYGITLSEFADSVLPNAGILGERWRDSGIALKDIEYLAKEGWIEQR